MIAQVGFAIPEKWQAVTGVGRNLELPPLFAAQAQVATNTLDLVHADANPVSGQIPLQPLRTVGLPRALVGRIWNEYPA